MTDKNRRLRLGVAIAMLASVAGCAAKYTIVPPRPVAVTKARLTVTPAQAWNKAPRSPLDIEQEENWTRNGPLLDAVTFVGGLPDGKAVVKQRKKADRKVPTFRADMNAQDLSDMIESYYRIKAGAQLFETTAVAPATFLAQPGFRFDYDYVGSDEVKRRGRAVGAIVGGKLYLAILDAARLHYFDAAAPEFDRMVATAHL